MKQVLVMPKINYSLDLPFAEQIAYLQGKIRLPTETWQDIYGSAHDRAFVVAGATKAELLTDLHNAVIASAKTGMSLQQFAKQFDSIVAKHGWADLANDKEYRAWRAKTIYDTNLRMSHAAGRYNQMTRPEVLSAFPIWEYVHRTMENPRLIHKAWNGTTLYANDAWWSVHYPPQGFGCKCTVYARPASYADQLSESPVDEYETVKWQGKEIRIPKGVQAGFDYVPKMDWYPNLDRYPQAISKQLVADWMIDGVFYRWIERINQQKKDLANAEAMSRMDKTAKVTAMRQMDTGEKYPVAVLSDTQKQLLGSQTAVINLSEFDALKQAISRDGNVGFDVKSYTKVQRVIDDATLIVRQYYDKETKELSRRTLWVEGFVEGKKSRYSAVLHQSADGSEIYLKSYRLDSTKDTAIKKRGEVLFEKTE